MCNYIQMTIENSILELHNKGLSIKEIINLLPEKVKYMKVFHILKKYNLKINKEKLWFDGKEKEIKNLLDEGKTYKEIGEIFNQPDYNVLTVAQKFNWHSKNKTIITEEEKNNIIDLYKRGFTFNKIEKITGRCDTSIGEIIEKAGIIPSITRIRILNKSLLKDNKRFCSNCRQILELKFFYGRVCKECTRNNERILYSYKYKISPEINNIIQYKFKKTKEAAKKRGINFDLKIEDLYNLYLNQDGKCYYTKIPFELDFTNINILSIDRIDSNPASICS